MSLNSSRILPLVIILVLVVLFSFQMRANQNPPKVAYLRNEMPTAKLQRFKETVALQAQAYPDIYFLEALDYDKEIALTFDDGPEGVYTGQVLDVLKKYNIKATFFLIGSNLERYPDVVRRIYAEGHAIGNHSYNHPDLRKFSPLGAYDTELWRAGLTFKKMLGFTPAIYRPPYGAVNNEQIPYFAEKGLRTINWSIDTFDWDSTQNSPEEIVFKVLKYAHEGAIVLMHTSGNKANTVKALPMMIEALLAQGYTFKTIPEMLQIPATIEETK